MEEPVSEALDPVAVVIDPVFVVSPVVDAVAAVPVAVEAPVEQVTALGISVTPPRAQIDLATLRVVSWSSLEHLSAIQQDISAMKDLAVQMHSTSIPHFEGIASVAQLRAQSGRSPSPWAADAVRRAARVKVI